MILMVNFLIRVEIGLCDSGFPGRALSRQFYMPLILSRHGEAFVPFPRGGPVSLKGFLAFSRNYPVSLKGFLAFSRFRSVSL